MLCMILTMTNLPFPDDDEDPELAAAFAGLDEYFEANSRRKPTREERTFEAPVIAPVTSKYIRAKHTERNARHANAADAYAAKHGQVKPARRESARTVQPKFHDGKAAPATRTSPFYDGVCIEHPAHPNEYLYLHKTRTEKPRQWFWLTREAKVYPGTGTYFTRGAAIIPMAQKGWVDSSWV